MNYFPFDPDPYLSAIALDDKRLRRVFSEAVMVQSVLQYVITGFEGPYPKHTPVPPKLMNWLLAEPQNVDWFRDWTDAMYRAMLERLPARTVYTYVCCQKYRKIELGIARAVPKRVRFVNLAKSKDKGLDFTQVEDVHEAYRRYVAYQWQHTDKRAVVWTFHGAPAWAAQKTD